jgi:signal peptidase I
VNALRLGAGVLGLGAAALLLARRRYVLIAVTGDSMVPALRPGDRMLVRRASTGLRPGQLVVARRPQFGRRWSEPVPPPERPVWLVKRVHAVDADTGDLVLHGDNAARSWDSRQWGPCPRDRVLGVVVRTFRAGPSQPEAPA